MVSRWVVGKENLRNCCDTASIDSLAVGPFSCVIIRSENLTNNRRSVVEWLISLSRQELARRGRESEQPARMKKLWCVLPPPPCCLSTLLFQHQDCVCRFHLIDLTVLLGAAGSHAMNGVTRFGTIGSRDQR